jgi:hypothetical protein
VAGSQCSQSAKPTSTNFSSCPSPVCNSCFTATSCTPPRSALYTRPYAPAPCSHVQASFATMLTLFDRISQLDRVVRRATATVVKIATVSQQPACVAHQQPFCAVRVAADLDVLVRDCPAHQLLVECTEPIVAAAAVAFKTPYACYLQWAAENAYGIMSSSAVLVMTTALRHAKAIWHAHQC